MWLRFKYSVSLYFRRLSAATSLYFLLPRVPLLLLFNVLLFCLPLHMSSVLLCLAPFSLPIYLFLSTLKYFYQYATFPSNSLLRFFLLSPFFFLAHRIYMHLPSSLFFVRSSRAHSLTHFLSRHSSHSRQCHLAYIYSLHILSRTLTHSLCFFHSATVFIRLTR